MKGYFFAAFAVLLLLLWTPAYAQLEITEVVSKNVTLRLDEDGQAHDYAVLTNTGGDGIQIGGFTLMDGGSDAYVFDESVLMPGESVTVYCTGDKNGAPFKLAAEGETLYLYDAQGNLMQKMSVPKMTYNQRYCDGKILEGYKDLKNGLHLSELLIANAMLPVEGEAPDFIEICNAGNMELNLKGYGLTDNPEKPGKWRFPETILPPGGYMTVYLSEKEAGFSLSSDGECVLLTDPRGNALDYMAFGPQQNDVALAYKDGQWLETWTPTPNQANVITNKDTYEESVFKGNKAGLYINEVVASNGTFDTSGNAYDYVEFYNGTKKRIRLTDYFLSDDILNPKKWAFPKGSTLSPGGYAVVYMTGGELKSSRPNTYCAAFKIGKTNSVILLSDNQGIVDHVSLGRQYGNVAFGRIPGHSDFSFFEWQTPGHENPKTGFLERVGEVTISPAGGLFDAPVSVTLRADKGALIRYTLDGSTPTEESTEYTGPLEFSASTVLRTRAFADGMLSSTVTSASYLYGVNADVPVVSLITDQKYLTDSGTGLFAKGFGETPNYYQNWEYPIHVQYFQDNDMLINQLATFRTTGAQGLKYPQKSISIFARGALGEDKFYFNPFPNRDYDAYNALTLRSGGTEAVGTRFKDELLTSLAQGLNVLYQDALPVVVYINGEYWGHYNLREKINQDSIAQWEGITDEKIIGDITILRSRGSIVHGSRDEINKLISFCVHEDLNEPENLQYVLDRLDVMSYFDHAILEIISGNADMHNVRYYKVPGGKWKLALFDMDGCMNNVGGHPLDLFMRKATEKMDRFYHEPFAALMRVPKMRELFLNRFGEILHAKFLYRDLESKIDAWAAVIGPLMPDHAKRWKYTSLAKWQESVESLKQNARERPVQIVKHITAAFHLTDEQVQQYFGAFLEENKK